MTELLSVPVSISWPFFSEFPAFAFLIFFFFKIDSFYFDADRFDYGTFPDYFLPPLVKIACKLEAFEAENGDPTTLLLITSPPATDKSGDSFPEYLAET